MFVQLASSFSRFCFFFLLLLFIVAQIEAIGFPTGGGSGGCCCPCGGGGCGGGCISSCGCGRKKREAVAPYFKGFEIPCPQTEWRELMNEAIIGSDAISSLTAIQSALHGRYGENKFMVNCAASIQIEGHDGSTTAPSFSSIVMSRKSVEGIEENEGTSRGEIMPGNVHFSANGDGYCNVQREGIWCQTVALHA